MRGLVALASYPKSGNTWFRAFLTGIFGNGTGVDVNRLHVPSFGDRVFYDRYLGLSSSLLTVAELVRLRGAVFAHAVRMSEQQLIVKMHDAWSGPDADSEPPLPAHVISAAIYVVRDPRDVAVSFASHMEKPIDETIAMMSEVGFTMHVTPGLRMRHLPQHLSSWGHHVSSWLGSGHPRLLVVRYEDLTENPAKVFGDAMRFLGVSVTPEALSAAIAASSFTELARQESQFGFRERPMGASAFFRQGKANAWQDVLSPEQAARIVEDHGDVMARVGYQ
jgi:aryl sulfotransferase